MISVKLTLIYFLLICLECFSVELEPQCDDDYDCIKIDSSFCINKLCRCVNNYKVINNECQYFQCKNDSECQVFDKNIICDLTSGCICQHSYQVNHEEMMCKPLNNNDTNVIANNSKNYIEEQNFNKAIRNVLEEIKKVEKPNVVIKDSLSESDRALQLPKDCKEVQEKENVKNVSGVYRIKPLGSDEPIFVYCDMTTEGGGWTLIQSRQDGNVDFFRDWFDYKYGFGNIATEFWLGNDNIHRITYQNIYELRIDLEDFEGDKAFAKYNAFAIGSEIENYMIKLLGNYEGDAGDAMSYHIAMQFSTKDNDNDRWVGESCAREHTGGWWYNQCESANLNGQYLAGLSPQEYKGIYWSEWQGPSYSLKKTQMKIRPFVNY
jgi:hypothetical protein